MTPVIRTRRAMALAVAVVAVVLAGASLTGQAPAQPAATATDPQVRLKWFDQHQAHEGSRRPSRASRGSSWGRPTSAAG